MREHPGTAPSRDRSAGFTLVELAVVVALIAVMAAVAMMNMRTALATTRARAAATELGTWRTAVLSLALDCGSLPRQTNTNDPGLVTRPTWAAAGCWRGPYITGPWPKRTPNTGFYQYVGRANAKPIIRVRDLDEVSARFLALHIRMQCPLAALAGVGKSGSTWNVDFVALDAPTVP